MVDEAYLDRMLLDIYLCAFNILPVVYVCEEVYRRLYGLRHATGTMYRPYIMPKGGKTGGGGSRKTSRGFKGDGQKGLLKSSLRDLSPSPAWRGHVLENMSLFFFNISIYHFYI